MWVRDRIDHCIDFQREEVPVTASDTLATGTGFCHAKSHLLVALWRANGLPGGFGYQRLTSDGPNPPYGLHAFAAAWLDGHGWCRCDARGNGQTVACQFTPGAENLVYPAQYPGECTYQEVWAEPWPELVERLRGCNSVSQYRTRPIDLNPPVSE